MKPQIAVAGVLGLLLLAGGGVWTWNKAFAPPPVSTQPTPTQIPVAVEQLTAEKQPRASLTFSRDGHFVTLNLSNLNADKLEYNLIYDAVIRKSGSSSQINTGVSGDSAITGKTDYSYKQLLGTESSGKITYHEDLTNVTFELTLRNLSGYSVFVATYPVTYAPGQTVELSPAL